MGLLLDVFKTCQGLKIHRDSHFVTDDVQDTLGWCLVRFLARLPAILISTVVLSVVSHRFGVYTLVDFGARGGAVG